MNADAVFAIVIVFALVLLYLGPWQSVCTAYARQVIFEKRDQLFDMAADGELRFESQEYREIRSSLEMLIRFAHDATLLNFLVVRPHLTKPSSRRPSEQSRYVNGIGNPVVRNKVERLVSEAQIAIVSMIVAKSILILPIVAAYLMISNLRSLSFRKVKQIARPYGEMVQVEAETASVNVREWALAA